MSQALLINQGTWRPLLEAHDRRMSKHGLVGWDSDKPKSHTFPGVGNMMSRKKPRGHFGRYPAYFRRVRRAPHLGRGALQAGKVVGLSIYAGPNSLTRTLKHDWPGLFSGRLLPPTLPWRECVTVLNHGCHPSICI